MGVEEERVVLFYEKAFQRAVNRKGWTDRTEFLILARKAIYRIERDIQPEGERPAGLDHQTVSDIAQLLLVYLDEAGEERDSEPVS